jgi:integrase
MTGKIRVARRSLACPKCGDFFEDIGKKGYICPNCLTVPDRYYLDIHFRGKRVRVFCDKQGKPLDSYERSFDLLAHINYEINDRSFDPSRYIKSEQKEFYFSVRMQDWIRIKEIELQKGRLAPSTLKAYKIYMGNYYVPYFKSRDIREIRTYDIEQFYLSLQHSLSPKYQKCLVDTLKNFFCHMHRLEYIEKMPVFPAVTVDEKTPSWISRQMQDKILSFIGQGDRSIFVFLTRQGIRPGEARSLKVKDMDFGRGILIVSRTFSENVIHERTKSKRVFPRLINPELLPMLGSLCKNKFPESFVFSNPRTARPYNDKTINRIWNKACESAGVEIDLYNATRHSVASQASSKGAPLQAIKAVLGHTDFRTTLKYAINDLASQMIVFDKTSELVELPDDRHQTVIR